VELWVTGAIRVGWGQVPRLENVAPDLEDRQALHILS
jgi:hypothetical protein